MDSVPEVRFTRSGTVDIAYQLVGEGPLDIVLMVGWVSHLEMLWELPEARHWIERFADMGRVALFDKRGTGLSDRPSGAPSNAELVPDVLAVMDAAGMNAAAVVGWIDAAALALEVAATVPDRVTALVLGETLASNTPDEEHPWAPSAEFINAIADAIEGGMWGQAVLLPMIAPRAVSDEPASGQGGIRQRNAQGRRRRHLLQLRTRPTTAHRLLSRTIDRRGDNDR